MPSGEDAAVERRTQIARSIAAHRREGARSPVTFAPDTDGDVPTVTYADREITVTVDDDARERLDALLDDFHVFKIAQPATRKAPEGEIHLSALADAKHAADFVDELFLSVFDQPDDYALVVDES